MQPGTRWTLALGLAGLLGMAPLGALPLRGKDTEVKLTAALARERDPVKKAKYEIRLARLKLRAAKGARDNGEIQNSLKLLQDYHGHITRAWDWLQKSGRVPLAHKKPQGFKELDIALREDGRYLDDLKRAYSLAEREPIEELISDAERIRSEVLKALFPPADAAGR